MKTLETSTKKLIIEQDEYAESPREWCNLSKMIFFGNHSHLGDNHNINSRDYEDFNEMEEALHKIYDIAVIKKIYGYSHSGLTISTSPFSCPWDSGVLGFAIVTKEDVRENWSIKNVTKKYREHSERIIDGEIETLDQYVRGDVYSFIVEDLDGEVIDSCSGFYGDNPKTNGMTDHIADLELTTLIENEF